MGVRRFNSGRENRAPNDEAPGRDDIVRGRRAAVLVVRIFPAGPVAQLAEQQTLNLLVEGSIPSGLTIRLAFSSLREPQARSWHATSSRMP